MIFDVLFCGFVVFDVNLLVGMLLDGGLFIEVGDKIWCVVLGIIF